MTQIPEPNHERSENMPRNEDEGRATTFEEIAAEQGEEAAIRAGIAADPDTMELDEEWFANARPVSEAHPQVVEAYRRRRGKQKAPTKEQLTIRLDADLVAHFRKTGKGWQTRINKSLRKAVFGSQ